MGTRWKLLAELISLLVMRSLLGAADAGLATHCGGTFSGYRYAISSPNYPGNYPGDLDCRYALRGNESGRCEQEFHLQFLDFEVRPSEDCLKDYLRIGEKDVLCGNAAGIRKFRARNDTLDVAFHSGEGGGSRGFKILVTALPCFSSFVDLGRNRSLAEPDATLGTLKREKGTAVNPEVISPKKDEKEVSSRIQHFYLEKKLEDERGERRNLYPVYRPEVGFAEEESIEKGRGDQPPVRAISGETRKVDIPQGEVTSIILPEPEDHLRLPVYEHREFRGENTKKSSLREQEFQAVDSNSRSSPGEVPPRVSSFLFLPPTRNRQSSQNADILGGKTTGEVGGTSSPGKIPLSLTPPLVGPAKDFQAGADVPNFLENRPSELFHGQRLIGNFSDGDVVHSTSTDPGKRRLGQPAISYGSPGQFFDINANGRYDPLSNLHPNCDGHASGTSVNFNENLPGNYDPLGPPGNVNPQIQPMPPSFDFGTNGANPLPNFGGGFASYPNDIFDYSFGVFPGNYNYPGGGFNFGIGNGNPNFFNNPGQGQSDCCGVPYTSQRFLITSPGFPSLSYSSRSYQCRYTIRQFSQNVCRLRLNLKFFNFGAEDQFCSRGYLEVDGRRICGCKSGQQLTISFLNSITKSISIRYSGYPRIKFSGFFIEVVQEHCSGFYVRNRKSVDDASKEKKIDRNGKDVDDQKNQTIVPINLIISGISINSTENDSFGNANGSKGKSKRDLGYFYPRPSIGFVEGGPSLSGVAGQTSDRSFWNSCQALVFFNWVLAAKEVYLRGAQCTSSGNSGPMIPVIPIFPGSGGWNNNNPPANCQNVNVIQGVISSPRYPGNYPNNVEKCYRFHKAPGHCQLEISMLDFDLEPSPGCFKDYVSFSGQNRRYCGTSLKGSRTIFDLSRASIADVYFTSDSFGSGRGFHAGFAQNPCQY